MAASAVGRLGPLDYIFRTICSLTSLEHSLRSLAGEACFSESFSAHYIEPLIYPAGLTQATQCYIGAFLLFINPALYVWLFRRWHGSSSLG